jgi:hypothetical protein
MPLRREIVNFNERLQGRSTAELLAKRQRLVSSLGIVTVIKPSPVEDVIFELKLP